MGECTDLILETTNPTFSPDIPDLPAWNLTFENPARTSIGIGWGAMGVVKYIKIRPDDDDLGYVEHQVSPRARPSVFLDE